MPELTLGNTSPEDVRAFVADRQLAKKFLFWAFVISVLYIHLSYTYIIYKHHKVFVSALNSQHTCGTTNALERETARYILRKHYLDPTNDSVKEELSRYNFWRIWVLSMPVMIAVAIFMIVKYGPSVISPWFYVAMTVTVLYVGVFQMVQLPRFFRYPSFWDILSSKLFNGRIQQLIQFHTQSYDQIYMLLDARLSPCLDDSAEFSCMEVLPAKLKQELIRRYVSANALSNEYQAADFFESALKKRNYDEVIGYMRLGTRSDDLELLAGLKTTNESPADTILDDEQLASFRDNIAKTMVEDIQRLFKKAFYQILLPGWALFIYFIWFHRSFMSYYRPDVPREADAAVDATLGYFWPLVAISWLFYLYTM